MKLAPDRIAKLLSTPEAHHVAELCVLADDLKAATECFKLFFDKYTGSKTGENRLIADALFRDAVILFCSAFDKTNANRLVPEQVYAPPVHESALTAFYQLLDLRDTFAAHNFGTLRQHNIGVECAIENGQLKALCFGHQFASFGGWNANERDKVISLVSIAGLHNMKRIQEAEAKLWESVKKLSPTELAAFPDLSVDLPYPDEWRSGRKSFRQNTKQRRTIDPRDLEVKTPSQP